MITLNKTSNKLLLQALLSGIPIALASMSASATDIAQLPLLNTISAKPNIMLMLDNSGSMSNIVPDTPYDPATTYIATCPGINLVPAGTSVDINLVSGAPKIRYSSTNYALGTTSGQRCFATTSTYSARLNLNGGPGNTTVQGNYLDAEYTGNYLNWYFNASNTSPPWTASQQKKPGARSRIEIAKDAAGSLVDSLNNIRLGLSTYNGDVGGSLREIIGDVDSAKKTSVKTKIDALTATGVTPLAETLSDIGRYFATGTTGNLTLHPGQSNQSTNSVGAIFNNHNLSNDSSQTIVNPIQYSCQKSFAVLLTDGRPQSDRNISASLRDYTRDCAASPSQCNATPNTNVLPSSPLTNTTQGNGTKLGRTYESNGSDYLDDVAKGLFDMDLRPDLTKTGGGKNNLVTFTIGFADTTVANDPLLSDTATRAGGLFLSAANSSQLTTAFKNALTSINFINQSVSATSVAANSTQLNAGTQVYQAKFDPKDWSGTLQAFNIDAGTPATSSPAVLATGALTLAWQNSIPASRNIYTYKPSASAAARGIPFQWADLTKDADSPAPLPFSQQTYLNTLNGVVDTAKGTLRLDWLRGDHTNEKTSAADTNPAHIFRKRTNILGDIVNSGPVHVGTEDYGYGILPTIGSTYTTFLAGKTSRTPMIYVGANDGMLHGFNAKNTETDLTKPAPGQEIFAYIPNALFPELSKLTSPTYIHQYYVDGASAVGDVHDGTNWRTVLVGTTGAGARAVFGLDVTNPNDFTNSTTAASKVLWEFTSADNASPNFYGADLGYTLAQPSVVRMQDGSWAVLVANGYDSANGHAVLFVLDALTGDVLQRIYTPDGGTTTNKNGLSSPIAVDTDNVPGVDTVYAGDLYGNLWKFNVSGAWGSWPEPSSPLFVACTALGASCSPENRQPITTKPNIGAVGAAGSDQNGVGRMVYFGTGKYFETGDNIVDTTPQVQTFYGLWDNGAAITDRANLQAQTIDYQGFPTTNCGLATCPVSTKQLRVVSKNPVCYAATSIGCTTTSPLKKGWTLNLLQPDSVARSERSVSLPLVRRGLVIFSTLIPDPDPCTPGGRSFLMEVDALSGGEFYTAPFGTNGDNVVNNADLVINGILHAAAGVDLDIGATSTPTVVESTVVDFKYLSGSSGTVGVLPDWIPPVTGSAGSGSRRSWRQLK